VTASTPAGGVRRPAFAGGAKSATSTQTADVAQSGSGRDRCLDLLRAVALLRVVVYHTFGWAWLALVFPSMGVMFGVDVSSNPDVDGDRVPEQRLRGDGMRPGARDNLVPACGELSGQSRSGAAMR